MYVMMKKKTQACYCMHYLTFAQNINVIDVSPNFVLLITLKYSGQEQNAIDKGAVFGRKGQ